jgi:hypothetical protein
LGTEEGYREWGMRVVFKWGSGGKVSLVVLKRLFYKSASFGRALVDGCKTGTDMLQF